MSYSPLAVANEFIRLAGPSGIDHMKLQKLVYYVFEDGVTSGKNILNELPEVWKYGPVFDSLYREMKYHGADRVFCPETEGINGPAPKVDDFDKAAHGLIESVWSKYKALSGIQLSAKTHESGTPWYRIVVKHDGKVPKGFKIKPSDVLEASGAV